MSNYQKWKQKENDIPLRRVGRTTSTANVFTNPLSPRLLYEKKSKLSFCHIEESKEDFFDENGVFDQEGYDKQVEFYECHETISLEDQQFYTLHCLVWST